MDRRLFETMLLALPILAGAITACPDDLKAGATPARTGLFDDILKGTTKTSDSKSRTFTASDFQDMVKVRANTNDSKGGSIISNAAISVFCVLDEVPDVFQRTWRVRYAQELIKHIEPIYDSIPNLKPEQQQWLEDEGARIKRLEIVSKPKEGGARGKAQGTLYSSKEWLLRHAKAGVRVILNDLRTICTSGNDELSRWVHISMLFDSTDFCYALDELEQSGAITLAGSLLRLRAGSSKIEWQQTFAMLGHGILQHVVLPNIQMLEFKMEVEEEARRHLGGGGSNSESTKKPGKQ